MTRKQLTTGVAVAAALAVLGIFFIFNPFAMQASSSGSGSLSASAGNAQNTNGLVVQDETVGTGPMAQPGDTLTVNYTGKLDNGTVFDTSVGKAPISFVLGAGKVIPGWDQGLAGMQAGGKRILIIPPSLAYGAQGYGPIPANATLTFEVELVSITPAASGTPAAQ